MKNFYIPFKFIILFVLLFYFFLKIKFYFLSSILPFIFLYFSWSFRKVVVDYKDFLGIDKNVFYTPIQGSVLRVNDAKNFIKLRIHFYNPFGIFFPFPAEVLSTTLRSKDFKIFKRMYYKINLKTYGNQTVIMEIKSNYIFFKPRLWIVAGDRGRLASNMGMVPFGGIVKVLLPPSSTIQVKEGQKVFIGETIIARIKE